MTDYRACKSCRQVKPVAEYAREPEGRDGLKARCRQCLNAESKAWRASKPQHASNYHRQVRYGLTPEQYDAMLKAQNGKCAMCGRIFGELEKPHVDHSHETGQVRSLLHNSCNIALGLLGEDVDRFAAAIRYITKYNSLQDSTA